MRMILRLIISFLCVMSLVGCQKSENYQAMKDSKSEVLVIYEESDEELKEENADLSMATLKDIYLSDYEYEELKIEGIELPAGIVCLEEYMLISDKETNQIFQVNYEGEILNQNALFSVGQIEVFEKMIYVVDPYGNRIQVLDMNLNPKDEITLKDKTYLGPEYEPQSLAVNDEGVYVTGFSLESRVIDKYDNGNRIEIGDNFIGNIECYEDDIYLINSMVCYYDKENDTFGAMSSGPEWLMKINGHEIEKVCELPFGFYIIEFFMEEDGLICASGSGGALYRMNRAGEYVETIAYIPGLENEKSPQISKDLEGDYYLVMPNAGKLIRCHKK